MMRFDDSRFTKAALDDIRINRALYEVIHRADLLGFFLEYTDEFLTDNLALCLRFSDTGQLRIEAVFGIDTDEVHIIGAFRTKYCLYLIAFVFAQQAMINKYAGELFADGFGEHDGCHRGVYTAGQGAKCFAAADLLAQFFNGRLDEGVHLPVASALTNVVDEVCQHDLALLRMHDFRVELSCIELMIRILHCSDGADRCSCRDLEPSRSRCDIVGVTHPADGLFIDACKEFGCLFLDRDLSLAIFAGRCRSDFAAQEVRHELGAVADAQDGDTELEELRAAAGGVIGVDAVRPAGQDDALRCHLTDLVQAQRMRMNLAVDMVFTDAAGNQLIILSTKVQNQDHFSCRLAQSLFLL